MENDRGDPPLPLLCSHQAPWHKCPECGPQLAERTTKAANLIKTILTGPDEPVSGETEADALRATDEPNTIEPDRNESKD